MPVYRILEKRLRGETNDQEEIRALIHGFVDGKVLPEQMATWLTAVTLTGLSEEETLWLTEAMVASGKTLDLSSIPGIKVDKHSSGGVGDKVSLITVPIAAAAGVPVPKLTGRALGHTGGTADKLESIPGFRVELTEDELIDQVRKIGCAFAVASKDLAPADKLIYSLRDRTATVASLPLIVSSILSKKLAGGADAFVFDVKFGDGAFMNSLEDARRLACSLVAVSQKAGKQAVALLTSMDEPLGRAVGNALEVAEAIEVLKGEGPSDVREVSLAIAAQMIRLGLSIPNEEARRKAQELLTNGSALEKFQRLIEAQGGNARVLEEMDLLPQAPERVEVQATASGVVGSIATRRLGLLASRLGAGRGTGSDWHPGAGIRLLKKVGDPVTAGETLGILFSPRPVSPQEVNETRACFDIQQAEARKTDLIAGLVA
ncbi:MAG: thymidine phosphorylase [Armatimonadetes bacterium]|nr:thymidine phosphorylase [Armatimonadota bacterium]MDW8121367.1 thymidine phosphorylase [Armatimonadota bacterium]